jgi:hypothetical protein
MITSWDIYWITRLDSICVVAAVTWIALGIIMAVVIGPVLIEGKWDSAKRFFRVGVVVACSALFIGVFTPSTKEFAAIYLIPKIANNEQVQKVPENLVRLLNAKMEAWLEDMAKDKGKK